MKIFVGTKNAAKLKAVKMVVEDYAVLKPVEVFGKEVASGVADQPKSMEETVTGAKNRARSAWEKNGLGIGLESGLVEVPGSRNGFMDLCVAAVFDGKNFSLGLSSGFECPPKVHQLIFEKGLDMTQACNELKITDNPQLGAAEGLVGILTGGRIDRTEYTKQALIMALVAIEKGGLY